jgi:hypothetical protein
VTVVDSRYVDAIQAADLSLRLLMHNVVLAAPGYAEAPMDFVRSWDVSAMRRDWQPQLRSAGVMPVVSPTPPGVIRALAHGRTTGSCRARWGLPSSLWVRACRDPDGARAGC